MPFPDRFDPTSTSQLPGSFSLHIPHEELEAVVRCSERFSNTAMGSKVSSVVVCFLPRNRRRWVFHEANVVFWRDGQGGDSPDFGVIVLPHHFLDTALVATEFHDEVVIHIDREQEGLTFSSSSVLLTASCQLPAIPSHVPVLDFPPGPRVVASARSVECAARAMRNLPQNCEEEKEIPWPYVEVSAGAGCLRFVRDWTEFGGDIIDIAVNATGSFEAPVSFYAEVAVREMWLMLDENCGPVSFRVLESSPDTMLVSGDDWGMTVALGSDYVLRYRREVESALAEAGFTVDCDTRHDWSPFIAAVVDGTEVTVQLVRARRMTHSHARITVEVASGVPWTDELAAELNSWNDAWSDAKLLFRDRTLVAVRDVLVGSMGSLPRAVNDLVSKSKIVREVVGPLI